MKFVFLLLLGNITFSLFPQDANMVTRIWSNYKTPDITELEYSENEDKIKIVCADDTEIIIHPIDNSGKQLVEINKAGKLLYSFFSKYIVNPRYLSGVYQIQLSPDNSNTILLVAYLEGSSGISANMTFGVLFDIDKSKCQYLSTWGMANENFVDIDGNGIYKFVSIDYYVSNGVPKLIANVFGLDISGLYVINNSTASNNIFVLFFNDLRIEKFDWKQSDIELRKTPDVFEIDNYYPKTHGL
jgi:hypothetical protein